MRTPSLTHVRCPSCGGALALRGKPSKLHCDCGQGFPIRHGIPDLVFPQQLLASDEEFQQKYDQGAQDYDLGLRWLFLSFGENEDAIRSKMCDLLDLKPGARVLEIGCGTGKDSVHIAKRIGKKGELYLLELSSGMIRLAEQRLAKVKPQTQFFLANASHLPFADGTFDAVFHFGGLNIFGDIHRALEEMTRVVRVGGKVVAGDESVAPWLRRKLYGRILTNANALYKHQPPMEQLPVCARDVSLRWLLGNAFYVIDYVKGVGLPTLDVDLPIPGKRGGTLRSRYEDRVA